MGRIRNADEQKVSIFEVLMTEHRDVEMLFEQIGVMCEQDPSEASDLFTVLADNLLAHAHAEQEIVYSRFEQIEDLEMDMKEAETEHTVVESIVNELRNSRPDGEYWLAKLTVLKELVQHHVKEEEGEIFEKAKEDIDAEESAALCQAYLERKSEESGEPELEQAMMRKEGVVLADEEPIETKPRASRGKKPGMLSRLLG